MKTSLTPRSKMPQCAMLSVQLVTEREDLKRLVKQESINDIEYFVASSLKDGLRNLQRTAIDLLAIDTNLPRIVQGEWLHKLLRQRDLDHGELGIVLLAGQNANTTSVCNFWDRYNIVQDVLWSPCDSADKESLQILNCFLRTNFEFLQYKRANTLLSHENRSLLARAPSSFIKPSQHQKNAKKQNSKNLPAQTTENSQLAFEFEGQLPVSFSLGDSQAACTLRQKLNQASLTNDPVLLLGDDGLEYQAMARKIHRLRCEGQETPFVSMEFRSLPHHLHRPRLFGYHRDLYPGQPRTGRGVFEQAAAGTLFLTGIDHLSWDLQGELLRALQEGEFSRLGDTNEKQERVRIECQLILAAPRDLQRQVEKGQFRQDLFFRLQTFPIEVPGLEERREDLPILIDHYCKWFRNRHGKQVDVSGFLKTLLSRRNYKRNVDELYELLHRLLSLAEGGKADVNLLSLVGEYQEFSRLAQTDDPSRQSMKFVRERGELPPSTLFDDLDASTQHEPTLQDLEREYIERSLQYHRWNISETARILGISRKTLYDKMKRYGLKAPAPSNNQTG